MDTRVTHQDSVADMVRKGRDLERLVLARAVRWHIQVRGGAGGCRHAQAGRGQGKRRSSLGFDRSSLAFGARLILLPRMCPCRTASLCTITRRWCLRAEPQSAQHIFLQPCEYNICNVTAFRMRQCPICCCDSIVTVWVSGPCAHWEPKVGDRCDRLAPPSADLH